MSQILHSQPVHLNQLVNQLRSAPVHLLQSALLQRALGLEVMIEQMDVQVAQITQTLVEPGLMEQVDAQIENAQGLEDLLTKHVPGVIVLQSYLQDVRISQVRHNLLSLHLT